MKIINTDNVSKICPLDKKKRLFTLFDLVMTLRYKTSKWNTWSALIMSKKYHKRLRLLNIAETHLTWLIRKKFPLVELWGFSEVNRRMCIIFTEKSILNKKDGA